MKTTCPHCGQHYEMEDSAVGMTATCLTCQKDFTVSVAAAEPPPTEPQPVAVKPASEPTAARCPFCEMVKKHRILIVIGIILLALIVFSIGRDWYLRNEAKKAHERAAAAAREAEAALRQYKRTQSSGERLRELEKIYKARGFTASEKEEARELIDYMQKRAGETGYTDGERFFVQLRKEWGLE